MNNGKPIVSVIVTTYNRKQLLKETIESILNQTFTDYELIVVDNYSKYDFISFIKSFNDNRIRYFQNQNHGIIAVNRNFGIKKATGQYLAFCDDDDYWMPDKLDEQLKYFDDNLIGVGTNAIIIGGKKRLKHENLDSDILLSIDNVLKLKSNIFSSLMIRNKLIYFDESKAMSFVEDFEFNLKLVLSSGQKIKLLEKPLVYYRQHSENSGGKLKHAEYTLNVVKKYKEDIPPGQLDILYHKIYSNLSGIAFIDTPKKCRLYYLKAFKYNRYNLKGFLLYWFSFFPMSIRKMIAN
jgi:glycosyltransferase involved in cell wall biosynthesis